MLFFHPCMLGDVEVWGEEGRVIFVLNFLGPLKRHLNFFW